METTIITIAIILTVIVPLCIASSDAPSEGAITPDPLFEVGPRVNITAPPDISAPIAQTEGDLERHFERARYPRISHNGEHHETPSAIIEHMTTTGLKRHHAGIKLIRVDAATGIIVVHYLMIDNFTELYGLREVYEERHRQIIDVWIPDENGMLVGRRVHDHHDDLLGDCVGNLSIGNTWRGHRRQLCAITLQGKNVSFWLDAERKDVSLG